MRLNPFNPDSINVRRGGGGGCPGGGGGQLGCGAIVIALIGALVFGIDPGQMLGTMESMQGAPDQQQAGGESAAELCATNQYSTEA
ncbi:MAG TPA: neutral zinc metallopeptidase, partial [Thiobacillaceae bacterium]